MTPGHACPKLHAVCCVTSIRVQESVRSSRRTPASANLRLGQRHLVRRCGVDRATEARGATDDHVRGHLVGQGDRRRTVADLWLPRRLNMARDVKPGYALRGNPISSATATCPPRSASLTKSPVATELHALVHGEEVMSYGRVVLQARRCSRYQFVRATGKKLSLPSARTGILALVGGAEGEPLSLR